MAEVREEGLLEAWQPHTHLLPLCSSNRHKQIAAEAKFPDAISRNLETLIALVERLDYPLRRN